MSAERVYRFLLHAYPARFRSEYEREMTLLFRAELRSNDATALSFWLAMVWDVMRSATAMWVDALRAGEKDHSQIVEAIMKLVGGLAVLLGVFGAVNAMSEAVAAMRGTPGGFYLLAVALGGVAAALICTAGAALLRSTPARHTATYASVASLVIILIARLTQPWMSMFSLLIGIGLPIALLAVLVGARGRGTSEAA